jgi:hypothetical protein
MKENKSEKIKETKVRDRKEESEKNKEMLIWMFGGFMDCKSKSKIS